jgi:spore maturation protein CgeB
VGREIDTYRSEDELIDKLRFYLSHDEAAERIRAAGYARARRDHTWRRRFEQLFGALAC